MSEVGGKYKQIIEDLEKQIKDPKELEFVKEKFSELSLFFIDIIDRLTSLTDARIKELEEKQKDLISRVGSIQTTVDGIENDIYEDDDNYEFEIVCPYCNYEFTTDIEEEDRTEIECPECHNMIELDWNSEEDEYTSCSGSCSGCNSQCGVAEEEAEYNTNHDDKEINDKSNKPEDDDM